MILIADPGISCIVKCVFCCPFRLMLAAGKPLWLERRIWTDVDVGVSSSLNGRAFLVKVKVQASMEFVFACVAICNSVGVLSKSRQQLALTPLQVITAVSMLTMEFLPKVHKGGCSHSLEAWTLQGKVSIVPRPSNNMYIWNLYLGIAGSVSFLMAS